MTKKWKIKFSVACELTAKQVWPDGGAPENPTAQDVIDVMSESCHTPAELIREWNLDKDSSLYVIEEDMATLASWHT